MELDEGELLELSREIREVEQEDNIRTGPHWEVELKTDTQLETNLVPTERTSVSR